MRVGVWRAVVAFLLASVPSPLLAQSDEINALNHQVKQLYEAGKYSEAVPIAQDALALAEKLHALDDPEVATPLNNLAMLLFATNQLSVAEPLMRRALVIEEKSFGAEHPNVANHLNNLARLLQVTNRFAEAEPLYRRALAIDEKTLGPEHPNVANLLANLAELLRATNRFAEAEPLYRRAIAIDEKSFGSEHPDLATDMNNLARLLRATNRFAEAEPLYRRALAIDEKTLGPEHPNVGRDLNSLAMLLAATNRFAEAEPLYRRALAIDEKTLDPEHPDFATDLNNLAELLRATNRFAEAEALVRRALAIDEKTLGPEHPDVAVRLSNLASLLEDTNRFAEAEPLYRRALAIEEKSFGPEHPELATDLDNLATLLRATNRLSEAEPLMRRALAIEEKSFGPEHPNVANHLNNLAALLQAAHRFAEAEPLYRRALAIDEKSLGPEHPNVAVRLDNLATLLQASNRFAEAEPLVRRALAIDEKSFGSEHPHVATRLNNLATLLQATNRLSEAESLYRRALAIDEKSFGPDHPDVGSDLNNLALLRAELGDWTEAAQLSWRAMPIMTAARLRAGSADRYDTAKSAVIANALALRAAARAVYRADPNGVRAREEGFELAQWALQTVAADALAQMSARQAKGTGPLAEIVRERQDLISRRQAADKQLLAAMGAGQTERTNAIRTSVATLDGELNAIDKRLGEEFPDYASLSDPKPLGIATVQALLRSDEALILILELPQTGTILEESLIWTITKTDSRWVRSDFGTKALAERVFAVRCGLDSSNWTDAGKWPETTEDAKRRKTDQLARREACRRVTSTDVSDEALPPFDIERAHELYQALFGEVADLLKNPDGTGKQLLIVPSGPLTQLPFQVLVTSRPLSAATGGAAYRKAEWLARQNPVTILPSVSSLQALRVLAKVSHATKPFIGFGNPLLDGEDDSYAPLAKAAFERQQCARLGQDLVAARGGIPLPLQQHQLTDVAYVRAQTPLPETADEVCAVAHDFGAGDGDTYLGASASEMGVKALSANGALAQYRTVEFATHGALAGEMSGSAEPGLLLTPPDQASEEDDGYLSASEIAELKLDADWVILSACNTAGAGTEGAEALSGLARAFFYAGARSLLVSHWAVNSRATVKLITRAAAELRADPKIGRSEAMRRSALALIDHGDPNEAHPAIWAPFIVVGEGGRASMDSDVPITPAPVTGALSATSTPPTAGNATAPGSVVTPATKDMQASSVKASITKKARAKPKPKPSDWMTSIFGQ